MLILQSYYKLTCKKKSRTQTSVLCYLVLSSPSAGQVVVVLQGGALLSSALENTGSPCWSASPCVWLLSAVTTAAFWLLGKADVPLLPVAWFPACEPITRTGVLPLWSSASLPALPPLLHPSVPGSTLSSLLLLRSGCSTEWIESRVAATAFLPGVSCTESGGPPWPKGGEGLCRKPFTGLMLNSAWDSNCCCCCWSCCSCAWRSARSCKMACRRTSQSASEWRGTPSLQEASGTSWSEGWGTEVGKPELGCGSCCGWVIEESEWLCSGKMDREHSGPETQSLWLSWPPTPEERVAVPSEWMTGLHLNLNECLNLNKAGCYL